MGLYANSAPVDVIIATWPWGAYLGDESAGQGIRAKVSSWRRISPGGRDPARQGLRQLPQLDPRQDRVGQRRLRRGDPARRARLRLRGLGREHLRRPRGGDPDPAAHRLDPRRDQPQVGDPDRPRPRLHRGRARHRPGRALPRRGGLHDRHGGGDGAGAGDRRSRRSAAPARSPSTLQAKFMDALHGRAEEYLEWLDFVDVPADAGQRLGRRPRRCRDRRRGDRVDRRDDRANYPCRLAAGAAGRARRAPGPPGPQPDLFELERQYSDGTGEALRHDPAGRHAGRGDVALGGGEGARGAGARPARRADDRGRLPELEPEGRGALRLAGGARSWSGR